MPCKDGSKIAARIAIIVITIRSSIKGVQGFVRGFITLHIISNYSNAFLRIQNKKRGDIGY